MFLSSIFYPVDNMPGWFRIGSYLNPITWHTDGLRYFALGVGNTETILLELFAFSAFTLIGFFFAVRALKSAA
jgi:ABC-type multidrug transport system permease subunit